MEQLSPRTVASSSIPLKENRVEKRKCLEGIGDQFSFFKRPCREHIVVQNEEVASLSNSLETVCMLEVKPEESHESTEYRAEKRKYTEDIEAQLRPSKRRCWGQIATYHSREIERPKLVLDLDHTLMDSTLLVDLSPGEFHLIDEVIMKKDSMLHGLDFDDGWLIVKLRPFVHQFLEEVNKMFDLYIYTTRNRRYATAVVELLDPRNKYFPSKSKVISYQKAMKSLSVFRDQSKACTVVLDDSLSVWKEADRDNVIKMERYNFFSSSSQASHSTCQSLAELNMDEREVDGNLAAMLSVLKYAHQRFFHTDKKEGLQPDFARILMEMRENNM